MKFPKTKYYLEVDTRVSEDALLDTTVLLTGLENAAVGVKKGLQSMFSTAGNEAEKFNQTFTRSFRTLKSDMENMKAALIQAATPIQSALIPGIDQAVRKATVLAQSIAIVLNTLMGLDTAKKKVQAVTKEEEKLKKTSVSAGAALKRSLAGFDQINRLNGATGGSSYGNAGTVAITPELGEDTLSPQVQAMVDKIMGFLQPLQKIDFTPLRNSLQLLGQAMSGLGSVISESLQWVWFEVLVPLGTWIIQSAGPATVGVLTEAFKLLTLAISPVLTGIANVRSYLQPMTQFIQETVLLALETLQGQFQKLAQVFREKGQEIGGAFQAVGQALSALWSKMQPIVEQIRTLWLGAADVIGSSIAGAVSTAIGILNGFITFISGTLSGNWSMAWNGLVAIFRGIVNGIIGMFNGLISGVVTGINGVIQAINQVNFKLPDWDILGKQAGKSYKINIKTVSAPQIPYLAKGAVLPANKPFLAMVGDQKHGTNVEAPLSTIQEAVALVMDDMIASNMAGQEMIVGVLKELLEAVMGIQIGDEVIGRAVQRYNRKMAVVKGGYV